MSMRVRVRRSYACGCRGCQGGYPGARATTTTARPRRELSVFAVKGITTVWVAL